MTTLTSPGYAQQKDPEARRNKWKKVVMRLHPEQHRLFKVWLAMREITMQETFQQWVDYLLEAHGAELREFQERPSGRSRLLR